MKIPEGGKFFFHFFDFFLNSRQQQVSRPLARFVAGSIGFGVRRLEKKSDIFQAALERAFNHFPCRNNAVD